MGTAKGKGTPLVDKKPVQWLSAAVALSDAGTGKENGSGPRSGIYIFHLKINIHIGSILLFLASFQSLHEAS